MVGLQAVHIRAFLWRPVVKVVMDHVVHDVAAQSPDKHRHRNDLREHAAENCVETSHHQGGQAGGEDQPRAVKWRLCTRRFDMIGRSGWQYDPRMI